MTRRDCIRTLMEKVYIAKLAVLISMPNTYTTHWPASFAGAVDAENRLDNTRRFVSSVACGFELDPQAVDRSDSSTPFSRANCSNVIGMKDPRIHSQFIV